jgi:hypothetical protein
MSRTTSIEWWLQPTGFGLLVLLQSTRPPPLFRIPMCSQKSALLTAALSLCCTVIEAVTLMNLRRAIGVEHLEVGSLINALCKARAAGQQKDTYLQPCRYLCALFHLFEMERQRTAAPAPRCSFSDLPSPVAAHIFSLLDDQER